MRPNTLWILLTLTAALLLAADTARGDNPSKSEGQAAESVFTERPRSALRSWLSPVNLPEPLALRLHSHSACIEAARTTLSWGVSGGVPPYTVTVDGQSVHVESRGLSMVCGLTPADPRPCDPAPKQYQTFRATATDSRGVTADAEIKVAVASAPPRLGLGAVSAEATDTTLRLSWTAATGGSTVCAYELQYQTTAWNETDWSNSWTAISDTIAANTTEYLRSDLDPNRRYRYQVRARNNIGAGEWSRPFPETGARPGAPVLAARTAASGSVALNWSAAQPDATRWEYRQQSGVGWSAWTEIAGFDAATTEHTVSGLTEDARYHFQLRAVTANGASPVSAIASAVAGLTPDEPRVGADGIRILPGRYPTEGGHTYRLTAWGGPTSIVIDVPDGMRLITRGGTISHGPTIYAYVDEASGALLWLDPYTGRHAGYSAETPETRKELTADTAARFDAIIASIREQPLPPTAPE